MKRRIKEIISWLLVIIWMIIIFVLSNTPAKVSTKDSKQVIENTIVVSTNITNNVGITNYHPTESELKKLVKKLNGPLRETMHSVEYLILAILLLIALNNSNIKKKYLISIAICFIYCLTDEYHQTFISGRAFELKDILLDTIGASLGLLIYKIIKKDK